MFMGRNTFHFSQGGPPTGAVCWADYGHLLFHRGIRLDFWRALLPTRGISFPMLPPIPQGWRSRLKEETRKPYYQALDAFLDNELACGQMILPAGKDIFNALAATSYDQVRVLLVGQDPYPTPGHAHGLCFSAKTDRSPVTLFVAKRLSGTP